jgi:hypothetical protein
MSFSYDWLLCFIFSAYNLKKIWDVILMKKITRLSYLSFKFFNAKYQIIHENICS